jgi:hypothetical protein
MYFFLATAKYKNVQSNTTKVKVHLRNGVAEIFNKHQDLMGRVENDIIEIETNFENKLKKSLFVVQDAVFIVSNKDLAAKAENLPAEIKGTGVYVYAVRAIEITPTMLLEEISKEYEEKTEEIKAEDLRIKLGQGPRTRSIIYVIKQDVIFLKKVLALAKIAKKSKS